MDVEPTNFSYRSLEWRSKVGGKFNGIRTT
jgi:hypothetical protein